MNAQTDHEMKLAVAYADSLNPLLESILNPKPRFDVASDRREDGLAEAKEIQTSPTNKESL